MTDNQKIVGGKNRDKREDSIDEIKEIIGNNPGLNKNAIVRKTSLSKGTVYKWIPRLIDDGEIVNKGDNNRKEYYLTEKEIKKTDFQGKILFSLINKSIKEYLLNDQKTLFEEIKNKNRVELERLIKKNLKKSIEYQKIDPIQEIENSFWYLKEILIDDLLQNKSVRSKEFQDMLDSVNEKRKDKIFKRIIGSKEFLRGCLEDLNHIQIEDIDEKSDREILDLILKIELISVPDRVVKFRKTTGIFPENSILTSNFGDLITPRYLYYIEFVEKDILKRIYQKETNRKKIEVLKNAMHHLIDISSPYYVSKKPDKNFEDRLMDDIESWIDMNPKERYEKYLGLLRGPIKKDGYGKPLEREVETITKAKKVELKGSKPSFNPFVKFFEEVIEEEVIEEED